MAPICFDEISVAATKHVALQDRDAYAIALWCAFTHAHDCFDISPILATTSPTPECGKTTLLRLACRAHAARLECVQYFLGGYVPHHGQVEVRRCSFDEADTFARDNDELRGHLQLRA